MKYRRDIIKEFNISRRVIEGYESIGLIKPSAKDKYGFYLYDRDTVERIAYIRFLQKIGFKLKEIASFIDEPDEVKGNFIKKKYKILIKKRDEYNVLTEICLRMLSKKEYKLSNEEYKKTIRCQ